MTAKKKTLIELMLDAGLNPDNINIEYDYFSQDYDCYLFSYDEKPYTKIGVTGWEYSGECSAVIQLPEFCKNWKSTIITKQQFIDANNLVNLTNKNNAVFINMSFKINSIINK